MQKLNFLLIFLIVTFNLCHGQDKWTWSKGKTNQKVRGYYPLADKRVYYTEDQYARADREPTTKRPVPGQPQNDDIDDYTDANDEPIKPNNSYLPNVGTRGFGGNFNAFANYPQIGSFNGQTPNGILVGPGGPTGIIGRPPPQYPLPGVLLPSSFAQGQGGYPSFPLAQNFPADGVNNNPGFPNYNGLGQYPGQPATFPNTQQFTGSQYPTTQYPGVQYPQQPQYTEGYGLANINPGFNVNPAFNSNFQPNYGGFGYDEYPAQVEGKSERVKADDKVDKKVDDKVAKNLKKL